MTRAYRTPQWYLGTSCYEILRDIKEITDPKKLKDLLIYERDHMKRSTVIKAIEARIRKIKKTARPSERVPWSGVR